MEMLLLQEYPKGKDCVECRHLRYCSGDCDVMKATVENNKLTVEGEDKQWATA